MGRLHADRFPDESMNVVFDAGDLRELQLRRHVVVDDPEPASQSQSDGHAGLGYRVHVGGNHWQMQIQTLGETGVVIRIFGEDFAVECRKRNVVVGQGGSRAAPEEFIGGLVKKRVPFVGG